MSHFARPEPAGEPGGSSDPLGGKYYDPLADAPDLLDALMWAVFTGSPASRPPMPAGRAPRWRLAGWGLRPRAGRPAGRPSTPTRPGQTGRGRARSRWTGTGPDPR